MDRPSVSKSFAAYKDIAPFGSDKKCANCSMFKKPHRCTLVRGAIAPEGVCRFWEAKK